MKVGDRVVLSKETSSSGTVVHVDDNLEDITTVRVKWDDTGDIDTQWSNKLMALSSTG